MTDVDKTAIAIAAVEQELVWAKADADDWKRKGMPVPEHLQIKIANLKGAAVALRKGKTGVIT